MLPRIVIFGSLNMDFVVRVERLPAPGETKLGSGFQMIPGGKGANQACAVGLLGAGTAHASMAGCVGHDLFGDHLKASLAAAGVDVSYVHATDTAPTGVAMIWVDASSQNSIVVASGANYAIAESDVETLHSLYSGAKFALFQLETPLAAVAGALGQARRLGAMTILDPAPVQPLPPELMRQVDILTPNESEACLLLGRDHARITVESASEVGRALLSTGTRAVTLKLGDQGCFYVDGRTELFVPAFSVRAVDTTAAGDVFNAALAVALTEERPIREALQFANAAAGLSTTKAGAQSSVPRRSEVDAFLRSCAS